VVIKRAKGVVDGFVADIKIIYDKADDMKSHIWRKLLDVKDEGLMDQDPIALPEIQN
jgi:hypothetical protein